MASFNGSDLGPALVASTEGAPVELQIFAYPALNGIGANNCGDRGGQTAGRGVLFADDTDDLSDLEYTFQQYQLNATVATFVDGFEIAWDSVIITKFKPDDTPPELAPGFGVARGYTITLLHLLM
jgi:hypothetical protein